MTIENITLKQVKDYLRISGSEFDEMLREMLKCAIDVAKLYIDQKEIDSEFAIIKQGILAHVAIMFDAKYITSNLPAEILQYYKPLIRHKL